MEPLQRVARCGAQRLTAALGRHRPESAARTSGYKEPVRSWIPGNIDSQDEATPR